MQGALQPARHEPASDTALLGVLDVVIDDCHVAPQAVPAPVPACPSPTPIYTGPVDGIPSSVASPAPLGIYQAGDLHRYRFTVSLPRSVDNTFQGKSATLDFNWDAVAAPVGGPLRT